MNIDAHNVENGTDYANNPNRGMMYELKIVHQCNAEIAIDCDSCDDGDDDNADDDNYAVHNYHAPIEVGVGFVESAARFLVLHAEGIVAFELRIVAD